MSSSRSTPRVRSSVGIWLAFTALRAVAGFLAWSSTDPGADWTQRAGHRRTL